MRHIWRDTNPQNLYAEQAIIGTTALALRALQHCPDSESARQQAAEWWHNRNPERL